MGIYRFIVTFICLFINKNDRKKRRDYLLSLPYIFKKNVASKSDYKKFIKSETNSKSVLIVEPNDYHYELQPGYVKYFQDLGYNVDLFAQPNINDDSPFIKFANVPRIFKLSSKYQKKALSLKKISNYDFVFLSTSVLWVDNVRDSYINWLGFEPNGKFGFLMVEHNVIPYLKEYKHEKYISQHRLFTLGGQQNIPMLNPHYFGDFKIKSKSENPTFTTIINEKKNIEFLYKTIRKLISQNITQFKIIVTGRSVINEIPDDLQNYIEVTGKISFKELWEIYESADYFLPFLNPEIQSHKRYINGTVTGTWQSMLGFVKPIVVHRDFTNYYRLNDQNSIIYEDNSELISAIEYCINLDPNVYNEIQENIKKLSSHISHESISNLKFAISQIENQ